MVSQLVFILSTPSYLSSDSFVFDQQNGTQVLFEFYPLQLKTLVTAPRQTEEPERSGGRTLVLGGSKLPIVHFFRTSSSPLSRLDEGDTL